MEVVGRTLWTVSGLFWTLESAGPMWDPQFSNIYAAPLRIKVLLKHFQPLDTHLKNLMIYIYLKNNIQKQIKMIDVLSII
jgi:hypothetical protein